MIAWVSKALATAIHFRQLAEHGGAHGIRDEALLESALARPHQMYAYGEPPPDLADLAAALASGIARNHPFLDGNKRTAAVCCEAFLELNGTTLQATDAELYPLYTGLAEGSLDERDFAAWLRERLQARNLRELQQRSARYRSGSRRTGRPLPAKTSTRAAR